MKAHSQKHGVDLAERRVLKLLAGAPRGRKVNALLSHGFEFETLAGLVRAGLATARLETVTAGGRTVEIARIRITNAGRMKLEGRDRDGEKI